MYFNPISLFSLLIVCLLGCTQITSSSSPLIGKQFIIVDYKTNPTKLSPESVGSNLLGFLKADSLIISFTKDSIVYTKNDQSKKEVITYGDYSISSSSFSCQFSLTERSLLLVTENQDTLILEKWY